MSQDRGTATVGLESFRYFLIEIELVMKPRMHLVELNIFSLNNVNITLIKIINNLLKHFKILIFSMSFFSCWKLIKSFLFFFLRGDKLLKKIFFYLCIFWKCAQLLSVLFIIFYTMTLFSKKMLNFYLMDTWFHVQLDQKILKGLYVGCTATLETFPKKPIFCVKIVFALATMFNQRVLMNSLVQVRSSTGSFFTFLLIQQ